jgi:hypothetical protein
VLSWSQILHKNTPGQEIKKQQKKRRRRRKKIFYSKFSEEDPEEETDIFRPVELPHHQNGGGSWLSYANGHLWGLDTEVQRVCGILIADPPSSLREK